MQNVIIYDNVILGREVEIKDYSIIGIPPMDVDENEVKTEIGDFALIRSHSVIYGNTRIGTHFQTGHGILVRENNQIGNHVSIGSHSVIENNNQIGDDVRIHSNCFIPQNTRIERGGWIGPNVVITNALHPLCSKAKTCMKGAHIGNGAKIGANTTIAPDVKIGEMALIGAGAIITKDIPARSVVIGLNKIIKSISELNCRYGLIEKPYEE